MDPAQLNIDLLSIHLRKHYSEAGISVKTGFIQKLNYYLFFSSPPDLQMKRYKEISGYFSRTHNQLSGAAISIHYSGCIVRQTSPDKGLLAAAY